MLPEVPWSKFRVGSQFFVLNRDLAVSVIADKKIWRKFNKTCTDVYNCYVEEHYFSTFVAMAMEGLVTSVGTDEVERAVYSDCVVPRTVTYVEWPLFNNDGHPRSFAKEEVGMHLILSLRRNNSFLFARKFSDDCLQPLLDLSTFIFDKAEGTQEV